MFLTGEAPIKGLEAQGFYLALAVGVTAAGFAASAADAFNDLNFDCALHSLANGGVAVGAFESYGQVGLCGFHFVLLRVVRFSDATIQHETCDCL
jgi:hypothetical protein